MSTLDGLKLSTAKKPIHLPQIVLRRNKLSNKLWEQIQLAKSQIEGTQFVVKKFRSVVDKETGLRKQVEVPKRIREWWFKNEQGKMCVSIRYGTQTIELAKGKGSIEVESATALIKALELVKQAVEAGELDAQINNASVNVRKVFNKQIMLIKEVTTIKPIKPLTPQQQRIDTLKQQVEHSQLAVKAERQRQRVANAQSQLARAKMPIQN